MVIISKTISEPYDIVTELTEDMTISSISGQYSKFGEQKYLFLIVKDDWFDKIELLVEDEVQTGIGYYISLVDPMGKALHWGKQIIIENVYAPHSTATYTFIYKWNVVDNIFIIKDKKGYAKLNVYGYKNIIT